MPGIVFITAKNSFTPHQLYIWQGIILNIPLGIVDMKIRRLSIILYLVIVITVLIVASNTHGMGYGIREGNSSVKFSPDAKLIAFAYGIEVRPIRLIDLETGLTIKTFPVEKQVSDLSFSPNGELLAASITLWTEPPEGVIRVWNIHTGDEVKYIESEPVFFIRFLEDNKTIAYHKFGEIMLWNIEKGTIEKSDLKFTDVSHSADEPHCSHAKSAEKSIFARADRKEAAPVVVKDSKTDEIMKELPVDGIVKSLFFSADGETLAVLVYQGRNSIQLWDTSSWTIRQSFNPENLPVEGAFSWDGKLLAVHLEDSTLRIWDLTTQKEVKSVYLLMSGEKLLEAAERGDIKKVKSLISDGVDIEVRRKPDERTAIMIAAENGDQQIIQLLVEAGAEVDVTDSVGKTALMLAANNGHLETVKLLMNIGIDRYAKDQTGWEYDALMLAARAGHVEVVKILADEKSDLDTALGLAKTKEIAEILISAGANVNTTSSKWPALVLQSRLGHTEVVALLLSAGAEVNARDEKWQGITALLGAAHFGYVEIVGMLIESGADINARDNNGGTALMSAAEEGHTDVVRMLINEGSDVNASDNRGWTALMKASDPMSIARCRSADIVRVLIEAGADVNARDNRGKTALMEVSDSKDEPIHLEVMQMLIDHGADVNLRTVDYGTALWYAEARKASQKIELLRRAGAK
jgi:ankyrin repeat protein